MSGLGSNYFSISALAKNSAFMAVGVGLAGALATAGLSTINQDTGENYANVGTCASTNFSTVGDPSVVSYVDGVETGNAFVDPSLSNFLTMDNTVGGATTVSTQTQPGSFDGLYTYNSKVVMSNAAAGWSVAVATVGNSTDGTESVKVTTANGAQSVAVGQHVTLAGGTIVSFVSPTSVTVTQQLASGGVSTSYFAPDINTGEADLPASQDYTETATGSLLADGTVVQQATNQSGDVLFNPCDAARNSDVSANGGSPAGGSMIQAEGGSLMQNIPTPIIPSTLLGPSSAENQSQPAFQSNGVVDAGESE